MLWWSATALAAAAASVPAAAAESERRTVGFAASQRIQPDAFGWQSAARAGLLGRRDAARWRRWQAARAIRVVHVCSLLRDISSLGINYCTCACYREADIRKSSTSLTSTLIFRVPLGKAEQASSSSCRARCSCCCFLRCRAASELNASRCAANASRPRQPGAAETSELPRVSLSCADELQSLNNRGRSVSGRSRPVSMRFFIIARPPPYGSAYMLSGS